MRLPEWIIVPSPFDIRGYGGVLVSINAALENAKDRLVLDFSSVDRAYPDGMVPLIATLSRLRQEAGLSAEVMPPEDRQMREVFEGVGWLRYLESPEAEFEDLPKRTPQFTPIRPFRRDHLTRLHTSIMEVLISQGRLAEFLPDAIHWALWEVMDNVLNHAGAACGWVQASTFRVRKHINVIVVDSGLGIHATLSERHPELSEREAIRRAIEKGETRNPKEFKGYGLHGYWEISIQNGGEMLLASGDWRFVQKGRSRRGAGGSEPVRHYYPMKAGHQGTIVELMLKTDGSVDLGKALGHSLPMTMLELTRSSGTELVFDVREEASDLGTRDAGRRLCNKVQNLTQVQSGERVVLDFSNVDMISSSFADEFVAKLAAKFGRARFNQRFDLRGMTPTVNTITQIALWNRVK